MRAGPGRAESSPKVADIENRLLRASLEKTNITPGIPSLRSPACSPFYGLDGLAQCLSILRFAFDELNPGTLPVRAMKTPPRVTILKTG